MPGEGTTVTTMTSQVLLTTNDLAAILRCKPATVRRLAKAGKLPTPFKGTGQLRWRRVDIEYWINPPGLPVATGGNQYRVDL